MRISGLRVYHAGIKIFGEAASGWRDCVFANEFTVSITTNGTIEDPSPGLRRTYGSALLATDVQSQLVMIRGNEFNQWSAALSLCEGGLIPVFHERPPFELVKQLYWDRGFRLTSQTWPARMRALLHMWDGVFWQMFTTERSDIGSLLQTCRRMNKEVYAVDLDREYPDPSNEPLKPSVL